MADSDDEDILYDNDLGRNLIGGKRVKNVNDVLSGGKKDKRKLRKTLALCMAFLSLGLCIAILGPTLLSLKEHLDTTLPKISWVFAGRSVGYLTGAILGGVLFESFNPIFLLAVSLLICGIGITVAPFTTTLLVLGISISTVGVSMGALDTGANVVCLRMWGKKRSGTMLQALHFSFALGAFISPLVAAPFLAPTPANNTMLTPSTTPMPITTPMSSTTPMPSTAPMPLKPTTTQPLSNLTLANPIRRKHGGTSDVKSTPKTITETSPNDIVTQEASMQSAAQHLPERFAMAYIIVGVLVLLTSVVFFFFLCTQPKDEPKYTESQYHDENLDKNNFPYRTRIIILLFFFYFLYVGGEVAYGSFVSTFANKSTFKFEQDRASHVAALFWGAFALGRGLAICLASVISPLKMVIGDMVGCVSTSLVLTLFADSNENVLWIGSAVLGLSMASLFPSGIAWLESYTPVTGKTASFLVVGSALGEMCVPLVIGYLFDDIIGPMVLMYWMLATSAVSALIFVYVIWLVAENGQEKESLPAEKSPALELFQSVEEALPMEDLFKNGRTNKQMTKQLIPPVLKRKDHRE